MAVPKGLEIVDGAGYCRVANFGLIGDAFHSEAETLAWLGEGQ